MDNFGVTDVTKNNDHCWYIRVWLEKLRENFFVVSPEELHSIDEIMVAFKGRSILKQYLPNKPSKCGLKLWGRSEISGYIYDFGIY